MRWTLIFVFSFSCSLNNVNCQENLLRSTSVTCSASINEQDCGKVYDGIFLTNNVAFKWDFNDQLQSPQWIELRFASDVIVGFVRLMENGIAREKNIRDVTIAFSDGTQQQVSSATASCRARKFMYNMIATSDFTGQPRG